MGGRPSTSMCNNPAWTTLFDGCSISRFLLFFPFLKIKAGHVHSLVIVVFLVLFCSPLQSHTFYVTNTKDDGSEGSFRWAVQMCDWYPLVPDTVLFAIPLDDPGFDPEIGVWTIHADTTLSEGHRFYEIEHPGVYIDAFSQREFIGHDSNPYGPEIELVGVLDDIHCFDVEAGDVTIRGLCVNGWVGTVVHVRLWPPEGYIENVRISGCYFNIDPTGTIPKEVSSSGIAVHLGSGIIIGGDLPDDRNIFGPVEFRAVDLSECTEVEIINNYIGVDRTGTIEMAYDGIVFAIDNWGATGPVTIRDNLICGHFWSGISIQFSNGEEAVTTVFRNRIGEGLDGSPMGPYKRAIEAFHSPGQIIRENIIAHVTSRYGVLVSGDDSDFVTISRNSIYDTRLLGIENANAPGTSSGVDLIDGQYGPGSNEEIDPCYCDSVVTSGEGAGGTTTAYFTCMVDCTVEVFIGDPGERPYCSLPDYGNVYSGKTYIGDAQEIATGPVFSHYRFATSPALPEGAIITTTATNQNGSTSEFGCSCTIPLMGEVEQGCRPGAYRLLPPSPNPSSGQTTIVYHVPETTDVEVAVYDMEGRLVSVVVSDNHPPGIYGRVWRANGTDGARVPSGSYVVRMSAGSFVQSHVLSLAR